MISGLKRFLSIPFAYDCSQEFLGAYTLRKRVIERFVCPEANQRVLDIACGTGKMSAFLPDLDYIGFDSNTKYIQTAKTLYGGKNRTFLVGDINTIDFSQLGDFDSVLALGVFHHLDDSEVQSVCKKARATLRQGGRLVTLDPLVTSNQSFLEKSLIYLDRGRNIRMESEYRNLVEPVFPQIRIHSIELDFPMFQYTHIVMECIV